MRKLSAGKIIYFSKLAVILIVLGVSLQIISSFILNFFLMFMPKVMVEYNALQNELIKFDMATILRVCVLAPVLEELVFRILILRIGAKFIPFWIMNIVQAVLFGLYHGNWVQGIYAFILGMVLGYSMHATDWILASIIVHMSINSMGFLMQKIPFFTEGASPAMPFVALGAFVLGGAMLYYISNLDNRGDYQ